MRDLSEFVLERPEFATNNVAHVIKLREKVPHIEVSHRDPDGHLRLAHQFTINEPVIGWVLHLPWERDPLPMNNRLHRHAKTAQIRMIRETAFQLARSARIPNQDRIRTRLDWEVIDKRTRDEDNLSYTYKSLVDGLRLAGVIHDDNRRYILREMPEIHYAPRSPERPRAFMRLHIQPV